MIENESVQMVRKRLSLKKMGEKKDVAAFLIQKHVILQIIVYVESDKMN
jgi:hypothetical protein